MGKEGRVELKEIKRIGERYDWCNSIGSNIYYKNNDYIYKFKFIHYEKDKQRAVLEFNGVNYSISTIALVNGGFGNIIEELRFREFKYKNNQTINTIKKDCLILDSFRDEDNRKKYICKCLECHTKKTVTESYLLYKGFTCDYCSDKISYPEKIMLLVLKELNIEYEYQKRFDWSKKVDFLCDKNPTDKIYDFYISSLDMIIEVNGELHYQEGKWSSSRPLSYITKNDILKEELAIRNGIKQYIIINCEISDFEYIKENIIKSKLAETFDFNHINWDKINKSCYNSIMKMCSDLWNEGIKSSKEISKIMGLSKATIITYLKKMSAIELCDYDPKLELKNGATQTQQKNKKKLICLNNGMIFDSATDCSLNSKEVFGESLCKSKISMVCTGKRPHHKGYHFKYVQDLTDEEKIKYNIIEKAS